MMAVREEVQLNWKLYEMNLHSRILAVCKYGPSFAIVTSMTLPIRICNKQQT
jgi:hypothetical protein